MAAKKLVLLHPTGQRHVYDNDPDAITRPDTVPAALRFAEEQKSSGIEHCTPRELKAYPRLPDLPESPDDPTAVDAPPQQFGKIEPRASDGYCVGQPSDIPRSGPRHRSVSTTPPPRMRRSPEPFPNVASRRSSQRPRGAVRSMPGARRYATWQLLLAGSLTTALSIAVGTSLADGSLRRVAESVFGSSSKRNEASPPPLPVVQTSAREPVAPPSARPVPEPEPNAEPNAVPVVRLEDLPVSKQDPRVDKARRRGSGTRRRPGSSGGP